MRRSSGVEKVGEGHGGQDERGPALPARHGQQAELDGEEQDEHDARPEHGHGRAEEDDERWRRDRRRSCGGPRSGCRAGSATASDSAIASTVSRSVVGMRSSTSGSAGARWKKDWPKSPRAVLARKRANCTGRGSLKPMAWRRAARSASGASGIMRATGSPLTWRMANVTSDHAHEHHDEADDPADEQGQHRAPSPGPAPPARATSRGLGVEEPEPLVPARRVLHLLRDARACRTASTGRCSAPPRGSSAGSGSRCACAWAGPRVERASSMSLSSPSTRVYHLPTQPPGSVW